MSTMTMGLGYLAIAATEEATDARAHHHGGGAGQAGDGIDEDGSQRRNDAGEDGPVYRARIRPIELKDAQELDGALIPGLAAGGLQQGAEQ